MIHITPLQTKTLFEVAGVPISETVVTSVVITVVLTGVSWLGTRNMKLVPGRGQAVLEIVVETIRGQIREVMGRDPDRFVPLLGTLFVFLCIANLVELLPGASSPTAHLETPAALAALVFLSVHAYGIAAQGVWGYLREYAKPTVVLLPLNVLSELTRTFSLTIRLFGNIMSHGIVLAIVVSLAGLLVPVPLMALSILIGLVQAYIFTILATVFIAAAVSGEKL